MEKMPGSGKSEKQLASEDSRAEFALRIGQMAKEIGIKPKNLLADYAHEEKFLRSLQKGSEEQKIFENSKILEESIFRTVIERIKSGRDGLTGLPNRCALEKKLKRVSKKMNVFGGPEDRRRREGGKDVLPSFLMFDIDNFKSINDNHGHQAGDKVLRKFSQTIRGCLREEDFVARYGGEEFLAIVQAPRDDVMKIAEKIRSAVEKSKVEIAPGSSLSVTVSIGISPYLEKHECETAIKKADQALYLSKGKEISPEGRTLKNVGEAKNQIWYFEPEKGEFEKFERANGKSE